MSVVNRLSLIVNQEDANGVNVINRTIGAIEYTGLVGQQTSGVLPTTGATTQNFPAGVTTVLQYYFKNTHATAFITVTWTHTTGASVVVQAVPPGGVVAFWNTLATSPAGITALSLQSDTANATFEQFIGG